MTENWTKAPRASFDLETTGVDPFEARIVTGSIVVFDGEGNLIKHHEWLADPQVEIPERAAAVHGITTEKARAEGADAAFVIAEIIETLEDLLQAHTPVVIYNASYDLTVLAAEARRHKIPPLAVHGPIIDPFVIDKQVDPYRKGKRTLSVVSELHNVELIDAHTSYADCVAALKVAEAMALAHPEELLVSTRDLHFKQQQWKHEQALSFQQYLRKTNANAEVDTSWPVNPKALELHTS